jgi:hypothetical protein
VPVTPEVHAAFKKLAEASGMSVGKAMSDWLVDTLEAVNFTAQKVMEARAAPKIVMREMHAYALGLADETGALMEKLREDGRKAREVGSAEAEELATLAAAGRTGHASKRKPKLPPSSNTGGKGTENRKGKPLNGSLFGVEPRRAAK